MRIFPAPQVVRSRPAQAVLRQANPGLAPWALEPLQVVVVCVAHCEERQTTPGGRHDLDFEPLPDARDHDLTAREVERVLRNGLPDTMTSRCTWLKEAMRNDHPPCEPADPDRCRDIGQQQAPLRRRRLGPDQERQAAQVHPPERNITRLVAKNLHTGVAGSGKVYWLIARHASDRRESSGTNPTRFRALMIRSSRYRRFTRQLAAQGCSVAACDWNAGASAQAAATAQAGAPDGVLVTGHACDVSDEAQVLRFRDELLQQHA